MLALLRQCGAFRAPAAASRLAPTRLLSVSPRIYESSSAAPASYALPVSDALLARVPESVRARDADVVEAYLLDALQLGLGALERVEGAGGAPAEVVASQRGVQAAATAEFVGELRSAYKDLDARLARTLEAVGAEDGAADVKGSAFELDVYDSLLALASVGGDGVEDTAYEAAAGSRSKVGDSLVTLQGGAARVAVEVKSGKFAMAGATSLERSLRDAMDLRGAQAAIGVVRAKHLGKRMGWYTALPGNVVVVAFEPDVEHGAVALQCAYKVLRAQVLADALAARDGDGEDAAALAHARSASATSSLPGPAPPHEECARMRVACRPPRRPRRPDREIRGALREIDSDLAAAPSG
ncbi:hypothetical protein JL720_16513 [Aureococcus anophagefferens]|nr:hypothetical protein JL720_16513 [Aureococcus anophagefferens]